MFTGIIRHVGEVRGLVSASGGGRLTIDVGPLARGLSLGDSIAVSGACLTAAEINGSVVQFDVIAETLHRTTLGEFRIGRKVNLERALTLGQGLDGHLVQGHVDGKAHLKAARRAAGQCTLEFTAGRELTDLM
ncbi:MAG: riboflavin synthase, partial [Planctomycetaceae bacterium]